MTMPRPTRALLLSTALAVPALFPTAVLAQDAQAGPGASAPPAEPQSATTTDASAGNAPAPDASGDEAAPEVSIPGSEIVVTGSRDRNIQRAAPQVVSVLSEREIARTGEGNIAGALGRVTGLSVVGNGLVYVRGLGDRYSLALLNGSPLPSPEPLRRVVPLDLFPTGIIASSLVQKSYSVNFPGEFGGGVINLTTRSTPEEGFVSLGAGIGYDTETTGKLGYDYYGSSSDWTGFDNGQRNLPVRLREFFRSGERISSGNVDNVALAQGIVNNRNAIVRRWDHIPPNWSATLSAGKTFELGDSRLGVIATAGYSNRMVSRDAINQNSLLADLSLVQNDFRRVSTDNRIVVNGMLGLGLEFGDNKIRWTNLYIRDTLKRTRLGLGQRNQTLVDFMQQDTAWYERQLIDTQLVAELRPADKLHVDLRAGYANSQREAPYEFFFEYVRTNVASDPYGQYFVNRLNNGNGGDATVSFSDLNEDLWSAGIDVSYDVTPGVVATVGYAYSDTRRTSSRRDFQFQAPNDFPSGVGLFKPDFLLGNSVIDYFKIRLIETNEGAPAFLATLRNHAGYAKVAADLTDTIKIDAGVRYETAKENVSPIEVFGTPGSQVTPTRLDNNYWLPAATVTWQFRDDMQFRASASKTIARPQFRELIYQFYFDPDSNRTYRGNPNLVDSELFNAEARWEWYFAPQQRLALAGFYKRIDRPIESFVAGDDFTTSFANAPKADLYGFEIEAQKNFDLSGWGGDFWASRQFVVIGNYTFTKSKLKVGAGDTTSYYQAASSLATDYFRDGAPLTGQSSHIANVQLGLEDRDSLSQQTLLFNYASKRVTSRGLVNTGQPDIYENPGLTIDFVARQGIPIAGKQIDLKFEARNLTGRRHVEYQQAGDNRLNINTYDVGRVFSLSAAVKF